MTKIDKQRSQSSVAVEKSSRQHGNLVVSPVSMRKTKRTAVTNIVSISGNRYSDDCVNDKMVALNPLKR